MASAGGSKGILPKARPSCVKRPAQAISSYPWLSPVAKAPPAKHVGQLWYDGPKVQKPWLKQVQKSHEECRKSHRATMMSKSKGSSRAFQGCVPPPPMVEVLRSLDLTAQWNARWSDEHVTSKDWRPERNTIVLAGRPVGVLIVSHQGASPLEWDAYPNMVFSPVRPTVLLGPTGMSVQAPSMKHKFTVIEWWKVIFFLLGAYS